MEAYRQVGRGAETPGAAPATGARPPPGGARPFADPRDAQYSGSRVTSSPEAISSALTQGAPGGVGDARHAGHVPPLYVQNRPVLRLRWSGRIMALGLAGGCLTVLLVAAWLNPSAGGVGTHTALGLARCSFLDNSGLPCPSCGMTTSFAHFVRGNFLASLYVQPMGTVLAALAALTFWGALYVGVTGRPAHRLLRFIPTGWWLIPLMVWGVASWVWKMVLQLRGIDGWTG